jgi:hypothetical protein
LTLLSRPLSENVTSELFTVRKIETDDQRREGRFVIAKTYVIVTRYLKFTKKKLWLLNVALITVFEQINILRIRKHNFTVVVFIHLYILLCIPRNKTARPRSQFLHSQIHECANQETKHYNSVLEI